MDARVRQKHDFRTCICQQALQDELHVLEAAIAKNAKAYCLWTHRLWVIDRLVELGDDSVMARELALCSKFLKLDERNFHCWSALLPASLGLILLQKISV